MEQPQTSNETSATLTKIQACLKSKDDTQRFVGLALLKSALDNVDSLRQDEAVLQQLWSCISPRFLERLIRTGSNPSGENAKEMLTLGVSVLHTFAVLLPDKVRTQPGFVERIPGLVAAVLNSPEQTTVLILQLLLSLVSLPEGAEALLRVDDLSPLVEIAPSHADVLEIMRLTWLNAMVSSQDKSALRKHVEDTTKALVAAFKGTDGVTLLEFLGSFLRQADREITLTYPSWMQTVINFMHNLVTSRPTPEARSAYTNAAASLLQTYGSATPDFFTVGKKEDKPFAYLFISLLLIDIRSSAPVLLEQLNVPAYPKMSRRLASAFDVICIFIGHLLASLEDESYTDALVMPPDSLLKLRKSISETMSVTIEYLQDRWDASVAGAMGLHPDARSGTAATSSGTHLTLKWDSLEHNADEDPFVLAAIRAVALWLREDDNVALKKEATGLIGMFMDLYSSPTAARLDFRLAILVALEPLVLLNRGRDIFLKNGGWKTLADDLVSLIHTTSHTGDVARGIDIVRVLLPVVEQESHTSEEWMDLVTATAARDTSSKSTTSELLDFQVAVLQICTTLLANAGPGMRKRYMHSMAAVKGIAAQRLVGFTGHDEVREALEDVLDTLRGLEQRG